jgi:cation diffusion facilitator CzcD-associated flavoprotein CzcO
MTEHSGVEHWEVVIVGAGISGICAAIKLREAGVDDVLVIEKADRFGGTWRANTYPGCACDVPSRLYAYSFAPHDGWSRVYAEQPEILEYVEGMATRHGIDDVTRFGTEMLSAEWDGALWRITTSDGALTARFLVGAAGPWDAPKIPDFPGLADFPGAVFHSAQWDHDYDLTGKRVAVIGTGASAVQFVPEIQPRVEHLALFQRTAHWVLPKADHAVPEIQKRALRRFPAVNRGLKRVEYSMMELIGRGFHRPKPIMNMVQKVAEGYLRTTVRDPELRAKLTPHYTIGCKRILFSNNWFQALQEPNVDVHATAVEEIRGNVVVGADGTEVAVDAIILGTGFHILDMPVADRIHAADGRSLADQWAGSPEAYLGTVVAGFPNVFIVLGPSLGTGHTSAFQIVEAVTTYVVDAIKHARATDTVLEVRPEVQAAYVAEVQAGLEGTAYNQSACNSYYRDANGRNSFAWPWSSGELVRRVSDFDPSVLTQVTEEVSA